MFLKVGVGAVSAGVACVAGIPAIGYLVYPMRNEVTSGGSGTFIEVGKNTQFGPDKPVKVDLIADRVDAWNRTKNVKIGSAWVLEREGRLVAYSTVCPHLGCAIDYDEGMGKFKCPCHESAFGLDGSREEGPAPRGLDELETETNDEGFVSIRFQRYKQGAKDKVPV
jgi:Rieske Fe-S protein